LNKLQEAFKGLKWNEIWVRFVADLKQAITSPTADPVVTLMVSFMLLVLVSLLVVIGLIIYTFATRGRRTIIVARAQISETDILIGRIILIVFVLSLILTVNYYAERTQSCLGCHPKQLQLDSLSKTAHKGIDCIRCHRQRGVGGYLRQKVDFSRMLLVYYINKTENNNPAVKAQGYVGDSSCLSCHRKRIFEPVVKENIRMSHFEVIGSDFTCTDCHSQVAHPTTTKPERRYSMNNCLTCHDGVRVSKECSECHPKYEGGERVVKNIEISKISLPQELSCYGTCHDERKECLPCHGVTMPHPPEWAGGALPTHGRYAAFTKKKLCWRCHYEGNRYFSAGKSFCGKCHEIEFHGPDDEVYWGHQKFSPGNCEMLCHGPGFCTQKCHGPVAPKDPLPKKIEEAYFGYPPDAVF
jgi:ribosomal protein L31